MKYLTTLFGLVLLAPSVSVGSLSSSNDAAAKVMTTGNLLSWVMGLVFVLSLFFLLIWLMKKLNTGSVTGSGQMQVLGGLSLGMREKIVLLKVGHQQLILGVSPGHIEKLHVLAGEDCLLVDSGMKSPDHGNLFASKLSQFMQGKKHG